MKLGDVLAIASPFIALVLFVLGIYNVLQVTTPRYVPVQEVPAWEVGTCIIYDAHEYTHLIIGYVGRSRFPASLISKEGDSGWSGFPPMYHVERGPKFRQVSCPKKDGCLHPKWQLEFFKRVFNFECKGLV